MTNTITTTSREKLIEKLKKARGEDGFFTLSGNNNTGVVVDPKLSKEERVNQAIEVFENSLDHKPKEKTKIYLVI